MEDLAKYDLLARHTLHEFGVIIDLIAQNVVDCNLAKKIDIFFYIDQNRLAKKIYSDMRDDATRVAELYTSLCRVELAVKSRWQNDYRFIATPVSLHEYFG